MSARYRSPPRTLELMCKCHAVKRPRGNCPLHFPEDIRALNCSEVNITIDSEISFDFSSFYAQFPYYSFTVLRPTVERAHSAIAILKQPLRRSHQGQFSVFRTPFGRQGSRLENSPLPPIQFGASSSPSFLIPPAVRSPSKAAVKYQSRGPLLGLLTASITLLISPIARERKIPPPSPNEGPGHPFQTRFVIFPIKARNE